MTTQMARILIGMLASPAFSSRGQQVLVHCFPTDHVHDDTMKDQTEQGTPMKKSTSASPDEQALALEETYRRGYHHGLARQRELLLGLLNEGIRGPEQP